MSPIADIEQAKRGIVEEFALFVDWVDRYEYIIDLGQRLAPLPDAARTEDNRVRGCQSRVWIDCRFEDGVVRFHGDSDAPIVKGLLALLFRVYSDRTPDDILATPPDFFAAIDLGAHLTGSRANGLHAMIRRIQADAATCKDRCGAL